MFKNYLTIGWRTLVRSKGFSIINISGLTVGMAVAILITLWVFDEVTANKSFANHKHIGAIYHHLTFNGKIITHDGSPYPYGQQLKTAYPEIKQVVMASVQVHHVIGLGERSFSREGMFVDPGFVEMFSVDIIEGSPNALNDAKAILISRSLAKALAGDDALGKMIRFDSHSDLTVAGIFEDFPLNSKFSNTSMLMPIEFYASIDAGRRGELESKENFIYTCYVMTNEGVDLPSLSTKIRDVLVNSSSEQVKSIDPKSFVFLMDDWNLYDNFEDGQNTGGKIQFVWMFSVVGAFVLVLACINFMNLSTARAEKRSKEVGVRKVMGSLHHQLIAQFLSESFIIVIIAFLASILLVNLSLPLYNGLTEKQLFIPWSQPWFAASSLIFITVTSLLAGSYPALYLASFKPVTVLKGAVRVGRSNILSRKFLVVFQFTVSIAIIACTILVFQQISYTKDRPVGFDRENLIFIQIRTAALAKADYNLIRNDLVSTGVVENMSSSDNPITGGMSANAGTTWPGKDPSQQPLIAFNSVSHDFPATNGFEIVEGRDFSRARASDSSAVLINQMAADVMAGGKSAIGMKIQLAQKELEVIGVIKDQLRWGPAKNQSPHIYFLSYKGSAFLTIRFVPGAPTKEVLDKVKSVIAKYDPGAPFEYTFIDDDYAKQFKTEERIGNLAIIFATLAIFISCIGILGLASFAAGQRIRYIGIRKVLGASIFNVWKLLSTDFIILVLVAIVLATPTAWYFSSQWLQQYDYRIDISPWVFIFTCAGVLLITLITVSYQAVAAAMVNPVKSLRSE